MTNRGERVRWKIKGTLKNWTEREDGLLHGIVLQTMHEPVIKDFTVQEGVLVFKLASLLLCPSDPPSADLDQLELPILCDGLRRYLQDLPQPIIPTAIYAQLVHTAKGESRRPRYSFNDLFFLTA